MTDTLLNKQPSPLTSIVPPLNKATPPLLDCASSHNIVCSPSFLDQKIQISNTSFRGLSTQTRSRGSGIATFHATTTAGRTVHLSLPVEVVEEAPCNIISAAFLTRKGFTVHLEDKHSFIGHASLGPECIPLHKNDNHTWRFTAIKPSTHPPLVLTATSVPQQHAPASDDVNLSIPGLQHAHFHANSRALSNTAKALGLAPPVPNRACPCFACNLGKRHAKPTSKRIPRPPRHTQPFRYIHIDATGLKHPSRYGNRYVFVFTCDVSRFRHTQAIPSLKTPHLLRVLKQWLATVPSDIPLRGMTLRVDSVFNNKDVIAFLADHMINYTFSSPHEHASNGIAERAILDCDHQVSTLLVEANLPDNFWEDALLHAEFIHNHSATSKSTAIPVTQALGIKPDPSLFHRFGCAVAFRKSSRVKGSYSPRARLGIFLGVARKFTHGTYRVFALDTRKTLHSRSVSFFEHIVSPGVTTPHQVLHTLRAAAVDPSALPSPAVVASLLPASQTSGSPAPAPISAPLSVSPPGPSSSGSPIPSQALALDTSSPPLTPQSPCSDVPPTPVTPSSMPLHFSPPTSPPPSPLAPSSPVPSSDTHPAPPLPPLETVHPTGPCPRCLQHDDTPSPFSYGSYLDTPVQCDICHTTIPIATDLLACTRCNTDICDTCSQVRSRVPRRDIRALRQLHDRDAPKMSLSVPVPSLPAALPESVPPPLAPLTTPTSPSADSPAVPEEVHPSSVPPPSPIPSDLLNSVEEVSVNSPPSHSPPPSPSSSPPSSPSADALAPMHLTASAPDDLPLDTTVDDVAPLSHDIQLPECTHLDEDTELALCALASTNICLFATPAPIVSRVYEDPLHPVREPSRRLPLSQLTSYEQQQWALADQAELDGLFRNGVLSEISKAEALGPSQKPIPLFHIRKIKPPDDTGRRRLKTRQVAAGNLIPRHPDKHWSASVVNLFVPKIHIVLALCDGRPLIAVDVVQAFLKPDMPASESVIVFTTSPSGSRQYFRLNKCLYGLRLSPSAWQEDITRCLMHIPDLPLRQSPDDPCLFASTDSRTIVSLFVDDLLISGPGQATILHHLRHTYGTNDVTVTEFLPGQSTRYLGMNFTIDYDNKLCHIDQSDYIDDMLDSFGMDTSKPVDTPMLREPLPQHDTLESHPEYASWIGSLLWLCHSRPDISYAVSQLSQHTHRNTHVHVRAVKRVFRYLNGTRHLSLTLHGARSRSDLLLQLFTDASYAECPDTRRSHTGCIITLSGSTIVASSKKQPLVAVSACESELYALFSSSLMLIQLRRILAFLGQDMSQPTTMYSDSQAAIAALRKPKLSTKMKHVAVRFHKLRESLTVNQDDPYASSTPPLAVAYEPTSTQPADFLTKQLPRADFIWHRDRALNAGVFPGVKRSSPPPPSQS